MDPDIPRTPAPPGSLPGAENDRWRELVSAIGSEVASPLTTALERIDTLISSGRIDRVSLHTLRDEVESARRASMLAQQLARVASGRLRQSHERLSLAKTLQSVLDQRTHNANAPAVVIKPTLTAADVIVDASLLFGLLNALLGWAMACARSDIHLEVDLNAWPGHADLVCSFAVEPTSSNAPAPELDSLKWRLLEQTAWAMDLPLARTLHDGKVVVRLEFARTASDDMAGLSAIEIDAENGLLSTQSKPLAGSHVLVIASRREMRVRVCDAIRHMGLVIDLVPSVEQAVKFCRESTPDAIIIEAVLRGERLNRLRAEIHARQPEFPFIEIGEEGADFQMSGYEGGSMGRVGRDAIESALPSVLMFELSKTL